MSFTRSTTDLKVHQSLSDYPNVEDGLSAEELKKKFDAPAEQLQKDLNLLMAELEKEAEGFEASKNITAGKLYEKDTSPNTIQAKLLLLKQMIDEAILGNVPDDSITEQKLKKEYRDTLAVKNSILQEQLNSEFLDGVKLANIYLNSKYHLPILSQIEKPTVFNVGIIPNMSSTTQDGFSVSDIEPFDNNDATRISISSGKSRDIIIQFPHYVKANKISFMHCHNGSYNTVSYTLNIYGSNNGADYELMDSKVVSERTEDKITSEYAINTKYCKFIKLSFKADNATYLYGINIVEGSMVNELDINRLELNYKLDNYENGQKVSVLMPAEFESYGLNTKMKIGELDYIQMPNDMKANEYVDLTYNGTEFVRR